MIVFNFLKMKKLLVLIIIQLLTGGLIFINAQQSPAAATEVTLEKQYQEFITAALKLQVNADSIYRQANQKRRELAFVANNSERQEKEKEILNMESESFRLQKEADSLYSQARAIELKIMARSKETGDSPSFSPVTGTSGQAPGVQRSAASLSDRVNPEFLYLGETNVSSGLSPRDLVTAVELDKDYQRASQLMEEVSEINAELEELNDVLESRPRRAEIRRINRRVGELNDLLFDRKLGAMQIYGEVNAIRYKAAINYLENKRKGLKDSIIIRSGLVHEELALESFRQSGALRGTALDLRSDKYIEEFISLAYTEELKAFDELEKALVIYNSPSVSLQEVNRMVPLQADGRIDPALALSRSRSVTVEPGPADKEPPDMKDTGHVGNMVDYGFSVFKQSPYSANNPIPGNVRMPNGIAYSIQIGIFNIMMTPESFGGLYPVMSEREPGNQSVRYFTGVFQTLPEAENSLIEVRRYGFSDAFIIAYNDGVKIPVNRARQMEQRRQAEITGVQQGSLPVSGQIVASVPGIVVFKIQLGAFRELIQPGVFGTWQKMAGDKNIEYIRNNNGLYIYSIGFFNTFEEAVSMRDLFRREGVPDAFIAPYSDGRRISMEESNQLMRKQ